MEHLHWFIEHLEKSLRKAKILSSPNTKRFDRHFININEPYKWLKPQGVTNVFSAAVFFSSLSQLTATSFEAVMFAVFA
jgi:hypothetical protein